MPNRILRDTALDSDRIASVDEASEVLFYRLIMLADDFGRFDGRVAVIRARAFALRQKVSESDIKTRLEKLSTTGLIFQYEANSKPYIVIPRFDQRQRAEKSKFPDPPDGWQSSVGQVTDIRPASAAVVVVEGVVEGEGGRTAKTPRSQGSRLSPEWQPSEGLKAWASKKRPDLDIEETVEKFHDWWIAKPGKEGIKLDWDATFRTWVRNERKGNVDDTPMPDVVVSKRCRYCSAPAVGSVGGIDHCRDHGDQAYDRKAA